MAEVSPLRHRMIEDMTVRNLSPATQRRFFGNLAALADPDAFATRLEQLRRVDWVVYAGHLPAVPNRCWPTLGRYTHHLAIANSRLISLSNGNVRFTWKD